LTFQPLNRTLSEELTRINAEIQELYDKCRKAPVYDDVGFFQYVTPRLTPEESERWNELYRLKVKIFKQLRRRGK
jgi:hypothetical protein